MSYRIHYTKVPTRQYDPNFNRIYVVGRRFPIAATPGSTRDIYTTDFSGSFMRVAVHMSSYTDGDFWNLSGSGVPTFENIYTKNTPESFGLEIGNSIESGSQVIFDFFNTGSNTKTVWMDYYFVR